MQLLGGIRIAPFYPKMRMLRVLRGGCLASLGRRRVLQGWWPLLAAREGLGETLQRGEGCPASPSFPLHAWAAARAWHHVQMTSDLGT